MSRPFSTLEAKKIIKEHEKIRAKLNEAVSLKEQYEEEIRGSVEKLKGFEAYNILNGVPIDDLNRDKAGIRIKALKDAGYETIAQLSAVSVNRLALINGISQDTAFTIKRAVDNYIKESYSNTKIRISSDNRNEYSTSLIYELYQYQKSLTGIDGAGDLLMKYGNMISFDIQALQPATGSVKWLFASGTNKKAAERAYNELSELLHNNYYQDALDILYALNDIIRSDPDEAWQDFGLNSIKYFTLLEKIAPGSFGTENDVYGLPEELAREIQDECFFPDGLLCTLRRYQEWGVKYTLHQERVLLGDEMGLGKTVQAIATMVSLKNTGAKFFIVVCPASVITNWCREIEKHSRLTVTKIHGTGRKAALNSWIETGGVAVTTYETTSYINLAEDFRYTLLVVDEAHYIKNPEAARSRNVYRLSTHADRMMFMTGTALENKVDEMINLITILQPNVASQLHSIAFMSSAPKFRERIAPVYYRRKREDVLSELPELIENREWCVLSREEEEIYERDVLSKNYAATRRVSWNVPDVLNSCKGRRLKEIVEEAAEDGRKIIVFSFFLDTIRAVCELLSDRCINPINGSISPQRRQEIIDEFDNAPPGTILPAQIQSGGTGLNIQSASVVVICEPQFKPSIENQAISRAYRMGQARNVLVYRLLCVNTVDERILEMLEEKQAVFDAFADKSVAAQESIELDDTSFGDIIKEEIDRINKKYEERNKPVAGHV
ncbi:MAG: DEAD/DEAH box helicase family protein [Lachnospiraceae bacterium]|nr:DEAD/DEAH box helicase family protein [Lachnospiraceae bacterium]